MPEILVLYNLKTKAKLVIVDYLACCYLPLLELKLLRHPVSIRMRFDDRFDLWRVAAAHAALNGDTVLVRGLEDYFVALAATADGTGEPAKLVGGEDVDACLVEDEVGLDAFDEAWQRVLEEG